MDKRGSFLHRHLDLRSAAQQGLCRQLGDRQTPGEQNQKQTPGGCRFETEPGYQAQVDFGEFQIQHANGRIEKLYLFAMILGYLRKIYAQFVQCCDLPSFLDGHIKAFAHFAHNSGQFRGHPYLIIKNAHC